MSPDKETAKEIIKQKPNYLILDKNNNSKIRENSYHGYGLNGYVHVDFAFIEKEKKEYFDYEIIKQETLNLEGSDHRPIILTIN